MRDGACPPCPLCAETGGILLWQHAQLRVVAVDDAEYPGFTRVIWQAHAPEMTDLTMTQRQAIMAAVYCVEAAARRHLGPDKINLAAFGNIVPHLHWHIIPRWRGDRHFPDAYWAAPRVAQGAEPVDWHDRLDERRSRLPAFHAALILALTSEPALQ